MLSSEIETFAYLTSNKSSAINPIFAITAIIPLDLNLRIIYIRQTPKIIEIINVDISI